jgi:hypothetical protein
MTSPYAGAGFRHKKIMFAIFLLLMQTCELQMAIPLMLFSASESVRSSE